MSHLYSISIGYLERSDGYFVSFFADCWDLVFSCEIVRTSVRRGLFLCNKKRFLVDRSIFFVITLDLWFLILDLLLYPISSGTEAILRFSFVDGVYCPHFPIQIDSADVE